MKILFMSDLHFSDRPIDQHFWGLFDQMLPVIDHENINAVYVLGDICQAKSGHSATLVNNVVSNFANLTNYVSEVVLVHGNHDGISASEPFFKFLNEIEGITYLSEPTVWTNKVFLPHSRHPEQDWKDIDLKGKQVFAHVTVAGAVFESGVKAPGTELDVSYFNDTAICFSGDIHSGQELGNLVYVGCPYNIRFNDRFDGGAIVFDDATNAWQRIPFDFPRRHTFDFHTMKELNSIISNDGRVKKGDQAKLRLHVTQKNMAEWQQIKSYAVTLMAQQELELCGMELVKELYAEVKADSVKSKSSTLDFDKYCAEQKIQPELVEFGKEIMNAVA